MKNRNECVLHFGMHKTGSTSIQQSLAKKADLPEFDYLRLGGRVNGSGSLMTVFKEKPWLYHANRKKGLDRIEVAKRQEALRTALVSALDRATSPIFLSAEDVSAFDKGMLVSLRDFFDAYINLRLVGYIRAPKSYMESAFQQRVKGGRVNGLYISKLMPKYAKFRNFDKVFDKERVAFWPFDPLSFRNGDVVSDFCDRLGIEWDSCDSVRSNEALSLPALKLLFCYRKFGPGYGQGPAVIKENNRLIRKITELPGAKVRFHSELVRGAIEAGREDLDWVERRLDASLTEDLTRDDDFAIKGEDDLLDVEESATQWLASVLGSKYEDLWRKEMKPREVAEWMQALRLKLGLEAEKGNGEVNRAHRKRTRAASMYNQPVGRVAGLGTVEVSLKGLIIGDWVEHEISTAERLVGAALVIVSQVLMHSRNEPVVVGGLGGFLVGSAKVGGARPFRPARPRNFEP